MGLLQGMLAPLTFIRNTAFGTGDAAFTVFAKHAVCAKNLGETAEILAVTIAGSPSTDEQDLVVEQGRVCASLTADKLLEIKNSFFTGPGTFTVNKGGKVDIFSSSWWRIFCIFFLLKEAVLVVLERLITKEAISRNLSTCSFYRS